MFSFPEWGYHVKFFLTKGPILCQFLKEIIYWLLHVYPISTAPYHPQTDGLVEHFNRTLKTMLKKVASEEGRDWDTLLPYVLLRSHKQLLAFPF